MIDYNHESSPTQRHHHLVSPHLSREGTSKIYMKQQTLLLLLLACCLYSCHPADPTITVVNESRLRIDSFVLKAGQRIAMLPAIDPGKTSTQSFTLPFESNTEGSFSAFFYLKDTTVWVPDFGYYSNTRDIDERKLILKADMGVQER